MSFCIAALLANMGVCHLCNKLTYLLIYVGGVWMYKLGVISQELLKIEVKLLLSVNRKSHMQRRLAQQQTTLSDLEWQFHGS